MRKFFKDNKKISSQIIKSMALENPKALTLWLGLKDIANVCGICVASQQALEDLLHVKSRMTVYKATKYLVDKDYIKIGKIGNQNAYILNPNIVTQLRRDNGVKILSDHGIIFKGSIALTKEENPELYKEFHNFIKKNPSPKVSALNKVHIKLGKHSKNMKIYSTKSEAKKHNGYYQPAMIKFGKNKSQKVQKVTQN